MHVVKSRLLAVWSIVRRFARPSHLYFFYNFCNFRDCWKSVGLTNSWGLSGGTKAQLCRVNLQAMMSGDFNRKTDITRPHFLCLSKCLCTCIGKGIMMVAWQVCIYIAPMAKNHKVLSRLRLHVSLLSKDLPRCLYDYGWDEDTRSRPFLFLLCDIG